MKIIRLTLFLFAAVTMLVQHALAQDPRSGQQGTGTPQGTIRGTVLEADSGDPIATATVAVWHAADSTLVTGTVTQDDGRFVIEGLRGGQYYAQISFVGFKTQTASDVTLGPESQQVDLGTIRLAPDTQMMEEVEVTTAREFMEIGIDRTVYNTRDQLVSLGGNATDVLQNIPSVEVDIEGKVSLRGNENVAILINGRPSPMTGEALTSFLQGLPAADVERVEVIPNPSARYEPDGMAGILNIVLRQDRDPGLSGGVSVSAETKDNYNASANLSYGKGRLGLTASYGFRYGSRDVDGWRFRENRFLDPLTLLNQDSFDERDMLSHTFNTSLEYRLSPQNTLSLSSLLSHRGSDRTGLTAYTELDAATVPTARFDRSTEGEQAGLTMDYRLAFRRIADPSKHELTAEVRYNTSGRDDFQRFTQEAFEPAGTGSGLITEQQTNDQDERNQEASLQVDYLRPLGQRGKLEAGYKGSLERINSDFYSETFDPALGAFTPDVHLNNTFDYDQQIHATYGIVGTELGPFGLQGGARLEQAFTTFDLRTTGETFENNYFSVFPSAFLTYALTDTRTLKLSYSKRINRPRTGGFFNQLNPFESYEDPLFRRRGNPYLRPEYVHAFEASYAQFTNNTSLTLTPYFRRTVDVIRFHETVDARGVSLLTFENFDTSDSWGAELIGTLRLGRRLNTYASFNAYRIVTDGSNVDTGLASDAFGFATRMNATVNIRPGLDLQASYFYRSPIDIENGRISSRTMADVALRQQFLDNRASLSLRMNDVFGTMGFHSWREDERFFQEMDRAFDAQRIGLTFTYNFGQSQQRTRRGRNEQQGQDEGMSDIEMQM